MLIVKNSNVIASSATEHIVFIRIRTRTSNRFRKIVCSVNQLGLHVLILDTELRKNNPLKNLHYFSRHQSLTKKNMSSVSLNIKEDIGGSRLMQN